MADKVCGKRMWSYQHWACQRSPHWWGRHRFNNYTGARVPHIWRIKPLYRLWKGNRRLRRYGKPRASLFAYRRVWFPDRFDPVPVVNRPKEKA